ncbi:MAG: hypothetical protein ABWZ25_17490 [Chitinophagaceae bacterium]
MRSVAQHYIEAEAEIAFMPSGLAIIDKFANCLGAIEAQLVKEQDLLNATSLDISLLQLDPGTAAAVFIKDLTAKTDRHAVFVCVKFMFHKKPDLW